MKFEETARFTIPGEPQGKGRPRFARAGDHVRTYTPDKTAAYEELVKWEYQKQCKGIYFGKSPIIIDIKAYFSIPKSTPKKKREPMLNGEYPPTKKPDLDNILKIIADSLNGIAYIDDSQIITAKALKAWAIEPRVEVTILSCERRNKK